MKLRKWDDLPSGIRRREVRPYYCSLRKKTVSLRLKRILDVIFAVGLLIALAPVFLILAVLIKRDSKGPVFFRQERVTQYGRIFRIFKFRTMSADAEHKGAQVTLKNDCRITDIGRVLRKYRLDELPQLINILAGDMTFVGTRPEVPDYVRRYQPAMRATLLLPAGVTSEASIYFKDEDRMLACAEDAQQTYLKEILPRKMAYNLEQLKGFSIWRDFKTLVHTVVQVARG